MAVVAVVAVAAAVAAVMLGLIQVCLHQALAVVPTLALARVQVEH